ncbi:indole-3-glycerol phosphate synthase TrpC [Halalkalibacillus sediminis]|uniref:Indole-3-glycerol phosphate synthase n=1 Tax=Halalkalibacillus sediminis TaxID=2018042 RepID=A0A2I0QS59_9BACI|nr:indole-3-glycerol phosphate synthase TrpC [Halalkalibacillus sediminis]PKR77144.1 indole-3-glycerol phosphate synthase TrpC [Halalkalibacillus sediminis]
MSETILDRILNEKRKEVRELKFLGLNYQDSPLKEQKKSLYSHFKDSDHLEIIAEIKRASPSKGDINIHMEPVDQASIYERGGAGAISILTDTPFFKGTMDDLYRVSQQISLPVLCKDFIIDEIQIDRAKQAGADVILLIAAAMDQDQLKKLHDYATSQNLEVLLEVHNEEELVRAQSIEAKIIGINNRNLKTFEVDLGTTEHLASKIDRAKTAIISESGMKTQEDAERVAKAGVDGLLIGETLMTSGTVAEMISNFRVKKGDTLKSDLVNKGEFTS